MDALKGKRYLVFGVAAESSIAWGICHALAAEGATVTLGYQKRFLSRVQALVKDQPFIEAWKECDVASEESVARFFTEVQGDFDGVVHAVAFAPAEALANPITKTTEADFQVAMTVSAYSLVRLVRNSMPRLRPHAAVVALTYLGAQRIVAGYRVMGTAKAALESLVRELASSVGPLGVRVNAISAGPIKTLAASGVPGFDMILDWVASSAPLRRNVSQDEVGRVVRFLLSHDSSGITGQTIYVDAGYSIVGAPGNLDRVIVEPEPEIREPI